MRVTRRGVRVAALLLAVVMCPVLVFTTTTQAEAFVPAPLVPVAGSVLGGTGSAAGGTLVGTTAGGLFTIGGTAAAAAAVYFGTAYGTYQALKWVFNSPESAGTQPSPSDYPGLSLPQRKLARCMGTTVNEVPAGGFTFQSCPTAVGGWVYPRLLTPGYRCLRATVCSIYGYALRADGSILAGLGARSLGATAQATSANVLFDHQSASGADATAGILVAWDPADVEWFPAPLHRWRTITTCKNKTTGSTTTTTNTSSQFSESDPTAMPIQVPQCQSGTVGTKLEIWEGDATGLNGTKVYQWDAPADVSVVNPTSPYKSCYPGGTDAPCTLTVYKVTTEGQLQQCSGTVGCTDYNPTTSTTAQYRCFWGTHSMPLSDCAPMQQWTQQTGTETTTDPTTAPSGGSIPTTGTNPTVPDTQPAQGEQSCIQAAWSWNPVDWVYVPVKCALKWAFVPSSSAMTALSTRLKTAFSESAPGKWVGAIGGISSALNGTDTGDCLGPHIAWDKLPGGGFYPFKACDGIMATIASITHLLATVTVSFFGGLACLRALGSGLGWNPGVGRPTT